MPVTVGGRTGEPHCGARLGSGDLPAPGSGRGMGFVLIAVLALVVDREPGVASGLLAHAARLEGAGGAVVTRDRTATDVGDVGFRHIPLNGRGRLPIPGGAALYLSGYCASRRDSATRWRRWSGTVSRHF